MAAENFQLGSHLFHRCRMDTPGNFLQTHRAALLIKFFNHEELKKAEKNAALNALKI